MEEYQSNSHKSREERKGKLPEKKVEKVVTGEVVSRKKSAIRKFADSLISNGIDSIHEFIIEEFIKPKAKEMVSEAFHSLAECADKLLYGKSNRYYSDSQPRQYSSYYYGDNRREAQTVTYRNSEFHSDEFLFRRRGDAEMVLRELKENLLNYPATSVADFKALIQGDTYFTHTDNNYGWTDLRDAGIRLVHGGYILELPKPVYLGD